MNLKTIIRAAQETDTPELVLKNGRVVNVFTGEIITGDVAVSEGTILGVGRYHGKKEVELEGRYVVPGFINAHLHVESSMVTPAVYAMEELRHGTTTIITDPHEIANVGGTEALSDILAAAERSPVNYYVMLPSCVPATPFEHAGAELTAGDLVKFREDPHVLGLGEMMNAVGVLSQDQTVMDKLEAFRDMIIDGHAPMLSGNSLNAYVCGGVRTDHESVSFEEAAEKLRCGLYVLVREGSASKNLEDIIKGVVSHHLHTSHLCFCTDDKHLADIRREGTVSCSIRKAVALGLSPIEAIQMATINAANAYGLRHTGAVACGYRADLVVLDDLEAVTVHQVYKDGVPIEALPAPCPMHFHEKLLSSVNPAPLSEDAFVIPQKGSYSVIGIVRRQIVTEHLTMTHEQVTEGLRSGTVRKIAVIERHHATGLSACAYITGYGLSHGAVGTTVAHDSHNIIVIGDNDRDMYKAVEELKQIRGGYTIIRDGEVVGSLPLELGGLMSLRPADEFIPLLEDIIQKAYAAGVDPHIDPFITLSFTALPVIPRLRITDCGLFDAETFRFIR